MGHFIISLSKLTIGGALVSRFFQAHRTYVLIGNAKNIYFFLSFFIFYFILVCFLDGL